MSALNTDLLPLEEKLLHTPSLEEITLSKYRSEKKIFAHSMITYRYSVTRWIKK